MAKLYDLDTVLVKSMLRAFKEKPEYAAYRDECFGLIWTPRYYRHIVQVRGSPVSFVRLPAPPSEFGFTFDSEPEWDGRENLKCAMLRFMLDNSLYLNDSPHSEDCPFLHNAAIWMVDLARPQRVFEQEARSLAVQSVEHLLRYEGWTTRIRDWQSAALTIDPDAAGSAEMYRRVLKSRWRYTGCPDYQAFDRIREWAKSRYGYSA